MLTFQTYSHDFGRETALKIKLARLVQSWAQATDSSEYVGTLFFNLRKAFDKVWHKGLLAKLLVCPARHCSGSVPIFPDDVSVLWLAGLSHHLVLFLPEFSKERS